LEGHRRSIEKSNVGVVASTEHVYKDPLGAFQRLRDLSQGLPVAVIPGLEWIAREGVEIIFWLDSEASLASALRTLAPFSHSVWDTGRLKDDLGAIACVPHPFTPGRTGAANRLGLRDFGRLLDQADYVEKHNGIAGQFDDFILFERLRRLCPALCEKIRLTGHLPDEFCRPGLGWSVGSDAHFPGELRLAGRHESMGGPGWFEALAGRLHFDPVELEPHRTGSGQMRRNLASLLSVMGEALMKRALRR
jgi:hypothetical protein